MDIAVPARTFVLRAAPKVEAFQASIANAVRRIGWRQWAVAYWAVAIATFGVSASDPSRVCMNRYSGELRPCENAEITFAGVFAGAAWPLYWSWVAAAKVQGPVA